MELLNLKYGHSQLLNLILLLNIKLLLNHSNQVQLQPLLLKLQKLKKSQKKRKRMINQQLNDLEKINLSILYFI
jgi:hypothetical protein